MKFQQVTRAFLILCITLMTTATFAQPGGGQRGGGVQDGQGGPPSIPSDKEIVSMVSDLADEIDLSELQEATVLQLYKEHFSEVKQKTKSGRPKREEMETLKSDFEDEVKETLTEDQQKLYINFIKKNQSKKRKKR